MVQTHLSSYIHTHYHPPLLSLITVISLAAEAVPYGLSFHGQSSDSSKPDGRGLKALGAATGALRHVSIALHETEEITECIISTRKLPL